MLSINLTIIIQMIGFLVFAWLLNQVFFKPIMAHLEARDRYLVDQQNAADRLLKEVHQLRADHAERLLAAKKEAQGIVDAATREAQERRRKRLADATAAGRASVEKARRELRTEVTELRGELLGEVAGIAERIAGQVLAGERAKEGAQA